jgi:cysteine desulfuration protein SufE
MKVVIMVLKDIEEDFAILEDWEDKYRYIIDLGRILEPLPPHEMVSKNQVEGCASQVWLVSSYEKSEPDPLITFKGYSDAHIVRGLVALVLALYQNRTASQIVAIDALAVLRSLGLDQHLSAQRANGLRSMIERIRQTAAHIL